ncbi:MAG TPA: isocitrate lyase/phosphoenolpyruvate mutase family protein [Stellaceae bacterium]|nr:isocitrate lyase/phosphoenolpyruvate mutase family protein [Stellaceae bacterium]
MTSEQARDAMAFAERHRRKPVLLLPNAWDGASARIFAAAGFEAVATTSGGLAWSLGYRDGEEAPWDEVVAATRRIVRAAGVPVTADIEAGYGATPEEVGNHVREIVEAGIVGINLEDGLHAPPHVRTIEDAGARIAAARAAATRAGVPIVLNARTDLYHFGVGEGEARFTETVARAKAYLAAGANCIYLFGVREPEAIARLAAAIPAPVNITGRAGMPAAAELERLGVARITIAGAPALVAFSAVAALAKELRATGRFDGLQASLRHPDAQALFSPKG